MTFKNLTYSVSKYVRLKGDKAFELIKDWINESIMEFARLDEWRMLKKSDPITLDNSNVYNLESVLTEFFLGELELFGPANTQLQKMGYEYYVQETDKSTLYSILGIQLYVTGDSIIYNFMYKSLGTYPLIEDDDENASTKYYTDIIKQMAIMKALQYLGDTEQFKLENDTLLFKLDILRKNENRINKQGKYSHIAR